MPRGKGTPRTGGRQKGTPNKLTADAKEALVTAFAAIGGIPALVKWGRKNPTAFYALWGKLLPREVKAEHSGPGGGAIPLNLAVLTRDDLDALESILGRAAAEPAIGPPAPHAGAGAGGTGPA